VCVYKSIERLQQQQVHLIRNEGGAHERRDEIVLAVRDGTIKLVAYLIYLDGHYFLL